MIRVNEENEIAWEKLKFPDEEDEEDDYEEEEYNDEPQAIRIGQIFQQQVTSPFFNLKSFKFHTGHTNFKLTKQIIAIINSVLGVESLEVISPYRFHISVGQRFDDAGVKILVTTTVLDFLKKYEKNSGNQ